MGGVAEQFHTFLNSELHAGECSTASRTGRFIPGNNVPNTRKESPTADEGVLEKGYNLLPLLRFARTLCRTKIHRSEIF